MTSETKWLTVKEVAARMKVSELTVRRMILRFDLRAVKVGRSWRVEESEVERVMNG